MRFLTRVVGALMTDRERAEKNAQRTKEIVRDAPRVGTRDNSIHYPRRPEFDGKVLDELDDAVIYKAKGKFHLKWDDPKTGEIPEEVFDTHEEARDAYDARSA